MPGMHQIAKDKRANKTKMYAEQLRAKAESGNFLLHDVPGNR